MLVPQKYIYAGRIFEKVQPGNKGNVKCKQKKEEKRRWN